MATASPTELHHQRRTGRWIRRGLLIAANLLAIALVVRYLRAGATDAAVGWLMLAAICLCFSLLLVLGRLLARRTSGPAVPGAAMPYGSGDLVEVMQSTDPVAMEVVRGKLAANGIAAEIIGQHASHMLGYLPVVPLRLMVPRQDAQVALQILAGKGAN